MNYRVRPLVLGEAEVPNVLNVFWSLTKGTGRSSVPILAFLIEATPDGPLLVDAGMHNPERAMQVHRLGPHSCSPEQSLQAQLGRFGLKPEDITTVVLTHLHYDHAGGSRAGEHDDLAFDPADGVGRLPRLGGEPSNHRRQALRRSEVAAESLGDKVGLQAQHVYVASGLRDQTGRGQGLQDVVDNLTPDTCLLSDFSGGQSVAAFGYGQQHLNPPADRLDSGQRRTVMVGSQNRRGRSDSRSSSLFQILSPQNRRTQDAFIRPWSQP